MAMIRMTLFAERASIAQQLRQIEKAQAEGDEAAKVEKEAIEWALPTGLLTNRVADARGLSARPFAYSFLYICY